MGVRKLVFLAEVVAPSHPAIDPWFLWKELPFSLPETIVLPLVFRGNRAQHARVVRKREGNKWVGQEGWLGFAA